MRLTKEEYCKYIIKNSTSNVIIKKDHHYNELKHSLNLHRHIQDFHKYQRCRALQPSAVNNCYKALHLVCRNPK